MLVLQEPRTWYVRLLFPRYAFKWEDSAATRRQAGLGGGAVKGQMGHSSIQVTVDTYGDLIPGANVSFLDRLDNTAEPSTETSRRQSAPPPHN